MVSSTDGGGTKTCWNRRSSAASFSMYLRYSSRVVAPIIRSSPRASIGLIMLPASIAPSAPPPAPTMVCSSSMKVITSPSASAISFRTAFSRSSNSPRYLAPATIEPMSRAMTRFPFSPSGTSPSTMRVARPSTMAVLPTPGSPMRTGLFLVRRDSTWMTRRISSSRPMTGSIFPWRAASVRSRPYRSSAWKVSSGFCEVTRWLPAHVAQRARAAGRGPRRSGRPWPAPGARPTGTRRPCRCGRVGSSQHVAQATADPGLLPAEGLGQSGQVGRRSVRATTAGSTPTRVSTGPAMPSGWSSTAAST